MSNLQHLLVFDLSKLGAAYQLINSFADENTIHVFEVSPVGTQALLMLSSRDLIALQFVYQQALRFHRADLLDSALIENIPASLIATYLSQNVPALQKNLVVLETSYFSTAFQLAKKLIEGKAEPVDFRVVRTSPPNLILTMTHSSSADLAQYVNEIHQAKVTVISDVQAPLKSYFQILK